MKNEELAIGDLVLQAQYVGKDDGRGHVWKPVKVKSIPFDEEKFVEPVPLCESILVQNGFTKEFSHLDSCSSTNMCDNFDTAFERRFLFKVQFGQPNTEAKKAIWKSKLSWLTDEESGQLAAKFDLSGGEIDNIVRKTFMEEVLTGNRPDVTMLEAWCRGERLTRKGGNAIGFAC